MAITYKVLGQSNPGYRSLVDLYTVPPATNAIISTLQICNTGLVDTTFRIAVRKDGASLSRKHYIYYDAPISRNSSLSLTLGISLASTDIVTIFSGNEYLSFSAFGSEIT